MKKPQLAIQQFHRALALNPTFGTARFRCAKVLMQLGHHEEALEELKHLKDLAPDESNVHFMLGRVYKQLERKSDALRHYTIAMNLDPKVCFVLLIVVVVERKRRRVTQILMIR